MAMGEVLRELGVKVSLAFDGKKVDEAENKIKKFSSEMKSLALEVAGLSAGLFGIGKSFSGFGRSVTDQANALNITTDALQEYEYAAGVAADATREDVVGAFQNLGDTLDKARAGVPEASQALYNMAEAGGVTKEMMAALQNPLTKVNDVALLLSTGIQKMSVANPMAARRMTELAFGSDKLYNLWRQGPDAIKNLNKEADRNSVINSKMLAQGKLMDQQLTKIYFIFRKFGLEIGSKVMPHVMKLVGEFTKWFAANKKMIASGINDFLDALANTLEAVFTAAVAIAKALGPVINMMGGTANAVKLLLASFVAFKAFSITASFIEMGISIFKVLGPLLQLGNVFGMIGRAFKAFSLIEGIADILPALTLFGEGALAALAPLLPVMAAIAAAGVAIHDIMTIMSGGGFKDTWTGKGWEKVKEGVGWAGDKLKGLSFAGAAPYGQVAPAGAAAATGAAGGPVVNQENNHTNNVTVMLPPGAKAADVTPAVAKGMSDVNEQNNRFALANAQRIKTQ